MRYLYIFAVFMVIVVKADTLLQGVRRMVPRPLVPVGSSFTDPVLTGTSRMVPPHLVPVSSSVTEPVLTHPGILRGGWNNMFLPQRSWYNFGQRTHGQWPHTWNSQNIWNTGIANIGNRRNNFNNNALANIDPWEQYRKFSSGYRSVMKGGISPNTIAVQNQIPHSSGSRNYPWNTFAFDTNIPAVTSGINQGFVNSPIQPNINNPFQNQGILPQSFPNSFPVTNGVFV